MATHELKTIRSMFEDILEKGKRFEIRKDDRGFQIGDELILREIDGDPDAYVYTGRWIKSKIKYILRNFKGIEPDYCILGIDSIILRTVTWNDVGIELLPENQIEPGWITQNGKTGRRIPLRRAMVNKPLTPEQESKTTLEEALECLEWLVSKTGKTKAEIYEHMQTTGATIHEFWSIIGKPDKEDALLKKMEERRNTEAFSPPKERVKSVVFDFADSITDIDVGEIPFIRKAYSIITFFLISTAVLFSCWLNSEFTPEPYKFAVATTLVLMFVVFAVWQLFKVFSYPSSVPEILFPSVRVNFPTPMPKPAKYWDNTQFSCHKCLKQFTCKIRKDLHELIENHISFDKQSIALCYMETDLAKYCDEFTVGL